MHFLDAWTEPTGLKLALFAAPVVLSLLALVLPGLRASAAAVGLAGFVLLAWPGNPQPRVGALLWALGGAATALAAATVPFPRGERPRSRWAVEGSMVAAILLAAWIGLLLVCVGQQSFSPLETRDATVGLALVAVGLFHLLLRRHLARAAMAFFTLGLGLAVLEGVARATLPSPPREGSLGILAATLGAVALALRLAWVRSATPGSAWVSDAHDLHD